MELERKALYTLLRLSWMQNPGLQVEPWQVEDLRSLSTEEAFERMARLGCSIDPQSFSVCAEQCDMPEELTGCFLDDEVDPQLEDKVYLLVFELWRRLIPEKLALSVFCDALDHNIAAYDVEEVENDEAIQNGLGQLKELLDESVDQGRDSQEAFHVIKRHLAHDIESFLYDYIAEQIDVDNEGYASELIDAFIEYVDDDRWLYLLMARVVAPTDIEEANCLLRQIVEDDQVGPAVDLNLDMLDFLAHTGDRDLFIETARQTADLITTEEDLIDLLGSCAEYYRCLDQDNVEQKVADLLESQPTQECVGDDPRLLQLKEILA